MKYSLFIFLLSISPLVVRFWISHLFPSLCHLMGESICKWPNNWHFNNFAINNLSLELKCSAFYYHVSKKSQARFFYHATTLSSFYNFAFSYAWLLEFFKLQRLQISSLSCYCTMQIQFLNRLNALCSSSGGKWHAL